jgi:hypothetical protein
MDSNQVGYKNGNQYSGQRQTDVRFIDDVVLRRVTVGDTFHGGFNGDHHEIHG